MVDGSGEAPLTNAEIAAWQSNMGIELEPWEVSLLRRLSIEHLAESQRAKDPYCKPPFGELYKAPNVDSKVDAALD